MVLHKVNVLGLRLGLKLGYKLGLGLFGFV